MTDGPYIDPDGVRWTSRYRKCTNCRCEFQRWGPRSGYRHKDGSVTGMSYCRPCSRSITLQRQRKVVGAKRCRRCGVEFQVTMGDDYGKQYGTRALHFCSVSCYNDSIRKYASKREKNREKKRRQRARHRRIGSEATT